jgi:hypothetical protein
MVAKAEDLRSPRVHLEKSKDTSTLSVAVPRDTDAQDFGALQAVITEEIIRDLTGCPCLSCAVASRSQFMDVIYVDVQASNTVH